MCILLSHCPGDTSVRAFNELINNIIHTLSLRPSRVSYSTYPLSPLDPPKELKNWRNW